MTKVTHDPHRAFLRITGEDHRSFLQGLITGDISKVTPEHAIWAALLTPQGKYLFDFVIFQEGDGVVLDVHESRAKDLFKRLKLYKLRAKVTIEDATDQFNLAYTWGAPAGDGDAGQSHWDGETLAILDPRHSGLCTRLTGADLPPETEPLDAFRTHRIRLGVPEGVEDLVLEKSTLVDNGFDELGGVAWNKGCYVGQEVTARMKYKGLAKKRLLPVSFEGIAPATGDPVMADGKDVGEIRSVGDGLALALLRLEALETSLTSGETALTVTIPDWVKLPERA